MNALKKIVSFFIGGYKTNNHLRIFKNTLYWINNDAFLKNCAEQSICRQEIIKGNDTLLGYLPSEDEKCQIYVTKHRTLEAARHYNNYKVCVLNFANATNPGGGVTISKGPSGQEECLCRVSTLYKCINSKDALESFYYPHKTHNQNNLHNDDIIYTPNVIVFKDDDNHLLDRSQWFNVDVISCAAPNIGNDLRGEPNIVGVDNIELQQIHIKRATRILDVAVHHKVEILILGAFGCGAFGNSPDIVAEAYKSILAKYQKCFKKIIFAIYCKYDDLNYQVFNNIIEGTSIN